MRSLPQISVTRIFAVRSAKQVALEAGRSYTHPARNSPSLQRMVWSLSKDDDGLDSVLPLADSPGPGAVVPPAAAPSGAAALLSRPSPPHSKSSRSLSPQYPAQSASTNLPSSERSSGSSSVVVDPISQVPEALGSSQAAGSAPRRAVEPTQILKGRRLDALRAEVAQRRKAHLRKQRRTLALWAVAGAGALCLGWLAGQAFTTPSPEEADTAGEGSEGLEVASDEASPPASASESGETSPPTLEEPKSKGAQGQGPAEERVAGKEGVKGAEPGAVALDDIPLADDEPAADEPGGSPQAEPSSHGSDDAAFSLDDLPTE